MTTDRHLLAQVLDPPRARLPAAALRDAIASGAAATRADGRDRIVVFDAARRRVRVQTWPADERPGLVFIAEITTEAAP